MSRRRTLFDGAPALKFGFRRDEAGFALGSVQLLDDMERAMWIEPVIHRHKMKIYDRGDLLRAWSRILAGEMPPMRDRRAKKQISKTTAIAPAVAESAERNGGPVSE